MKILKLNLDDAVHLQLLEAAKADDRTPEHYVLRAIKQALNHDPEREAQLQAQYENALRAKLTAELTANACGIILPQPGVAVPIVRGPAAPAGVEFNKNPNKPVETFGLMEQDSLHGQTAELPKEFAELKAQAPPAPRPTAPGGNNLFDHKV